MADLISSSILFAGIAMAVSGRSGGAAHVFRQPRLVTHLQGRDQYWVLAGKRQLVAASSAQFAQLYACRGSHCLDIGQVCRGSRDDVTRLVLAEPEGVSGGTNRRRLERRADAGGDGHFGDRNEQSAVGNVVGRGEKPFTNQRTNEIAGSLLGGE